MSQCPHYRVAQQRRESSEVRADRQRDTPSSGIKSFIWSSRNG